MLKNNVQYIVAVSGGVDSVVLLDLLARQMGLPGLVVAHFDHGIREDSAADRRLVAELAAKYGLPFEYEEGRLGSRASEAVARKARYDFLRRVKQAHNARRIVTAHHEDDVLETALLNIMRGTGRRGLSSLQSTDEIFRPLLTTPKTKLYDYAQAHGLQWKEDSTNTDTKYLRNYIRHEILPRFDDAARLQLKQLLTEARERNAEIDLLLHGQLQRQSAGKLDRHWFIMLPHAVAREVMAAWLRHQGIANFDRKLLEKLTVAAKSHAVGKQVDINRQWLFEVGKADLRLVRREH